jgi:hypothetical protein
MRRTVSRRHGGIVQQIFVVERYLDGLSEYEIDEIGRRCNEALREFTERGVRHLESILIPGDETCLSLFEGPDADTVRAANTACRLPTGRVLAAVIQPPARHAAPSFAADEGQGREASW